MTDAMFLDEDLADPLPAVGSKITLSGPEGRHAAVVRRIAVGERIAVSDGRGRAVRGFVSAVERDSLVLEVTDVAEVSPPAVRFVAVQALAKGDRAELAAEMLTEVGVDEIVPWQANRSIVRWSGDRGDKARAKWQSTVREATKQSRRLWVPPVAEAVTMNGLRRLVRDSDLTLILHEEAEDRLTDVELPSAGSIVLVIGPEGGIDAQELTHLVEAGGRPVVISDAVLRTSTAGVVALAQLRARGPLR